MPLAFLMLEIQCYPVSLKDTIETLSLDMHPVVGLHMLHPQNLLFTEHNVWILS